MVRGRMYIPGDAIRVWRSSSVPVDDLRSPVDLNVLHKAHMIKTHAVQDADAIRSASKRHDANFLNDISNKLAVATQPRPYYRESTPAYIGSRYSVAPPPTVSDYKRRTWYAPPVSDYEITNYLAGGPRPYHRSYRGASVPPVVVSPSRHYVPSVSRSVRAASVSPYEGQAPRYGNVVIGIPYSKSYVPQTNNHGLNHYNVYVPSRHSYAPPSGRSSVTPSYRKPAAYKSLYDDVDEILSTPSRHRATSRRYNDAELDVEWPSVKPQSISSLRGRAHSVQRQLDGIPEFHVYNPSQPRAASTIPTYTPAPASSVPYSSASSAPYSSSSAAVPSSYGGSSSTSAASAPKKAGRPPVSEARRKVRDLLCRSKNDPRYYDGF